MTKPIRGRTTAAPFFAPKTTAHLSNGQKPHHVKDLAEAFDHGIVQGKKVLVATRAGVAESEKGLEIRIRVALAAAGVLIWKHTVEACYACGTKPGARCGLGTGCSDLICVVPPLGRFLAIEVKKPTGGRTSPAQKHWLAVVRRFGGVTGVARSVSDAMLLVSEARVAP